MKRAILGAMVAAGAFLTAVPGVQAQGYGPRDRFERQAFERRMERRAERREARREFRREQRAMDQRRAYEAGRRSAYVGR
ncbi:hypothetical protein [Muricoccus radiodurans]|uniref:hypothetical protein n=1 Tax=Muricoccus radiodurans TaxID=2231721 RepID=UPI003CEBBF47